MHDRNRSALVERYIFDLARHGAYGETGVWRVAYSPEWVDAQNQVTGWLEDAGLEARNDAVGNVWGRLAGTEAGPVVATGSHIDSQNPGGRYDGALGVIARDRRPPGSARAVRRAAADARGGVALRGGGEPLPRDQLLGLARDRRRDRAGRSGSDPRRRRYDDRRGDGGGRPRPGADPRGRTRRHRHLDRAAHRAGADPRGRGAAGRRRRRDHLDHALRRRARRALRSRRRAADAGPPRPDGRVRRDRQRRRRRRAGAAARRR